MRPSKLSRIQTRNALRRIANLLPGVRFEEVPVASPGDRDRETDLRRSPDDFFTRDLDKAVLAGDLDCAVHSAKDLPDPVTEGLDWCWLPWREDARDVLVLPLGRTTCDLPPDARLGISSERRAAYCRGRFPDAQPCSIRGNVEDRIAQLDRGDYDALITAGAALQRLDMTDRITEWAPLEELPTPDGQGVLALTFRADDERLLRLRSLFVKTVVFVGAGAGDEGTCTLAGVRALERCDVCLHDALIDRALLNRLPRHAQCLDAGKRGGGRGMPQEEITRLIALHARRGRRVVRLKGGDPGLFGRLAEETEALDGLRLPYRVIPGVSSLNAATTGTGMLLTRRGTSSGFCAMTARMRGGAVTAVAGADRAKLPIVFFMGVKVAADVARQLIEDGTPAGTAAAFVFGARTDEQVVLRGELGSICETVAEAPPDGPGLFIVGDVARFMFEQRWGALAGRRVLLTCSRALQAAAADAVVDYGGIAVGRPLIRLAADPAALGHVREIGDYDLVVLTSPSAVRRLMELADEAALDLRALPKLLVSGPGTARELRRRHLSADAGPGADFGSADIVEAARPLIAPGTKVLRLRSDQAGTRLADSLRALGAAVEDCVLYRNEPVAYGRMPAFDAVFFASGSAVRAFASLWGTGPLASATVLAIGQQTAAVLGENGVEPDIIGPEATVGASISALAAAWVGESLEEIS